MHKRFLAIQPVIPICCTNLATYGRSSISISNTKESLSFVICPYLRFKGELTSYVAKLITAATTTILLLTSLLTFSVSTVRQKFSKPAIDLFYSLNIWSGLIDSILLYCHCIFVATMTWLFTL